MRQLIYQRNMWASSIADEAAYIAKICFCFSAFYIFFYLFASLFTFSCFSFKVQMLLDTLFYSIHMTWMQNKFHPEERLTWGGKKWARIPVKFDGLLFFFFFLKYFLCTSFRRTLVLEERGTWPHKDRMKYEQFIYFSMSSNVNIALDTQWTSFSSRCVWV